MPLLTTQKIAIELSKTPFAAGGEGELFTIIAPKEYRNHVAKIYYPHKREAIREQKFLYLLANKPRLSEAESDTNAHLSLIWVEEALYENGQFVGFIMPKAAGKKLEILCTNKLPKKLGTEWERFDFKNEKSLELRLRLAFNLCIAVHLIHETERYLLIDLKPDNVMIQPNGLVSLVDLDSVEVVEDGTTLFDAAVATPEYTPPEKYHQHLGYDPTQTLEWDRFSLAVILYKLLLGVHPFSASSQTPYDTCTDLEQKIQHGLFVHHPKHKDSFLAIPPLHDKFWELPTSVQELFLTCFINGHELPSQRPSVADWVDVLATHFGHSLELKNVTMEVASLDIEDFPPFEKRFKLPTLQEDTPYLKEAAEIETYKKEIAAFELPEVNIPIPSSLALQELPPKEIISFPPNFGVFYFVGVEVTAIGLSLVSMLHLQLNFGVPLVVINLLYFLYSYVQFDKHPIHKESIEKQQVAEQFMQKWTQKKKLLETTMSNLQAAQKNVQLSENQVYNESIHSFLAENQAGNHWAEEFNQFVQTQTALFIAFFEEQQSKNTALANFKQQIMASPNLAFLQGNTPNQLWQFLCTWESTQIQKIELAKNLNITYLESENPNSKKIEALQQQLTYNIELMKTMQENQRHLQKELQKITNLYDIRQLIFAEKSDDTNVKKLFYFLKNQNITSIEDLAAAQTGQHHLAMDTYCLQIEKKNKQLEYLFIFDNGLKAVCEQFTQWMQAYQEGKFNEKLQTQLKVLQENYEALHEATLALRKEIPILQNDLKINLLSAKNNIIRDAQTQLDALRQQTNVLKKEFKQFYKTIAHDLKSDVLALKKRYQELSKLCAAAYEDVLKKTPSKWWAGQVHLYKSKLKHRLEMLQEFDKLAQKTEREWYDFQQLTYSTQLAKQEAEQYQLVSFNDFLLK